MASSGTEPGGITGKPSYSRRIKWLGIVIIALILLYTAGWFAFARMMETQVSEALAQASRDGGKVECANPATRGYPFRIGLHCDSIAIEQPSEGLVLRAGSFRSAAQVYAPGQIVAELDGPLLLQTSAVPQGIGINWEALRASSRLATPLPTRLSLEGRKVVAQAGPERETPVQLATADALQAHMRVRGEDADVAASVSDLAVEPFLLGGRTLPALSGEADIAIANGVEVLSQWKGTLRGIAGEIRNVTVSLGGDTGLSVSGPLSVADDGLVDATLSVKLRDPQKLAAILGEAFPEARDQIRTALSGFAALAGSGDETPPLPVRIEKGRVTIAFLSVGSIPPFD